MDFTTLHTAGCEAYEAAARRSFGDGNARMGTRSQQWCHCARNAVWACVGRCLPKPAGRHVRSEGEISIGDEAR